MNVLEVEVIRRANKNDGVFLRNISWTVNVRGHSLATPHRHHHLISTKHLDKTACGPVPCCAFPLLTDERKAPLLLKLDAEISAHREFAHHLATRRQVYVVHAGKHFLSGQCGLHRSCLRPDTPAAHVLESPTSVKLHCCGSRSPSLSDHRAKIGLTQRDYFTRTTIFHFTICALLSPSAFDSFRYKPPHCAKSSKRSHTAFLAQSFRPYSI